ncbi:hypothetical protein [Miniphocaeibacter halophilus]|uniref:Uncharacterized protein n=1 Tax=Miniphocaeibacter halophilus TaxID=2931922 RepID=A0AC61NAK7_9FIRM|nr:hypothetical protein [Miniphocaeibacter halophilus]QQK08468.1 hypothetical protein JFY71_02725 [Miniphocaeibacter halophilus]
MKKYTVALVICALILILGIRVTRPNTGLDKADLFYRVDSNTKGVTNYNQKDSFLILINKVENKPENKTNKRQEFLHGFKKALKREKPEEETDNYSNLLGYYENTNYYNIRVDDNTPKEYLLRSVYKNDSGKSQDYIYFKDGKTEISKDNVVEDKESKISLKPFVSTDENYFNMSSYYYFTKDLIEKSDDVEYKELDENYFFTKELSNFNFEEVKDYFKIFNLEDYLRKSDILTYDSILNTEWDRKYFFVSFSVTSLYLQLQKAYITIDLEKDGVEYSINLSRDFGQLNLITDIEIPEFVEEN